MFWFKKHHNEEQAATKKEVEAEIAKHKKDTRKKVEQVKKSANKAVKTFDENGFTVKIFLAVGGKDPKQKVGNNYGH